MQQLERHIESQAQRAQLALDLALQQEGLEQGELELYVEEQLVGLIPRVLIADDEAGFRNIRRPCRLSRSLRPKTANSP